MLEVSSGVQTQPDSRVNAPTCHAVLPPTTFPGVLRSYPWLEWLDDADEI